MSPSALTMRKETRGQILNASPVRGNPQKVHSKRRRGRSWSVMSHICSGIIIAMDLGDMRSTHIPENRLDMVTVATAQATGGSAGERCRGRQDEETSMEGIAR